MFEPVTQTFDENCKAVEGLVTFDRKVLSLVIDSLEELHSRLKEDHASDQKNGGRVLTMVRNIRDNKSIRKNYEVIYGQAVVLLVSHFASAMADLFRAAISMSLTTSQHGNLLDEEIKLTFREMREKDWNMQQSAADLLIAKKDLTFQDMQSVARAFRDYLGVELERDSTTNNIILGQAARHVLVHAGGIVNDRMVRQLTNAHPRSLKAKVVSGDRIVFSPPEILELKSEMQAYLVRSTQATALKTMDRDTPQP